MHCSATQASPRRTQPSKFTYDLMDPCCLDSDGPSTPSGPSPLSTTPRAFRKFRATLSGTGAEPVTLRLLFQRELTLNMPASLHFAWSRSHHISAIWGCREPNHIREALQLAGHLHLGGALPLQGQYGCRILLPHHCDIRKSPLQRTLSSAASQWANALFSQIERPQTPRRQAKRSLQKTLFLACCL